MAKLTLDPVTRIEGHLKIEVEIDSQNIVTAAQASGTMFRGFENLLVGRDPRDAIHITQRICGVCPVPHATAAVEALELAFGVTISQNARLLRNLVQGTDFISDHLLHFYHLALLDYIAGPAIPPFTPTSSADRRFSAADNQLFVDHYLQALQMRRIAQEAGALFAGKLPHVMSYAPGGVTQAPDNANVSAFRSVLDTLIAFIDGTFLPDVEKLVRTYQDYLAIGTGCGNLLAYGAFPLDGAGERLFKAGIYRQGHMASLDTRQIGEEVRYSWYADSDTKKHPSQGTTTPAFAKGSGYSWLKAPRLQAEVYEVGALARMTVNHAYTGGISVMDRHRARALETRKVAYAMREWLYGLAFDGSGYQHLAQMPTTGRGEGFTEATRGALGHWFEYANGQLTRYQVVTPTCWNASPRDDSGVPGALEQALTGARIDNPADPVELFRIVRSFDPCMGCAVHVTEAGNQRLLHAVSLPGQ